MAEFILVVIILGYPVVYLLIAVMEHFQGQEPLSILHIGLSILIVLMFALVLA